MKRSEQLSDRAQSNEILLERCTAGDELAWHVLVRRFDRLIHAIAVGEGLSRDAADDVTQHVFTQLLRYVDQISEPEHLATWLGTVARHEAWRLRRRSNHTTGLSELDHVTDSDEDFAERHAQKHQVNAAVQALPEPCRTLILDLFFDPSEPDYRTVAFAIGRPVGSVGPMRARCLERLKQLLEAERIHD